MKLKGKSRLEYTKMLQRAKGKKRGYIINILRQHIDSHTHYHKGVKGELNRRKEIQKKKYA